MNFSSNNRDAILIKISGGCLKDEANHEIFDHTQLTDLCAQIKIILQTHNVGLVIGGGNLWRGKTNYLTDLTEQTSHYVGMLATMMNGLVLHDFLAAQNIAAEVFSGVSAPQVASDINPFQIHAALAAHKVVIFAGGTGMPYVSTDTASAVRAAQINASMILMGKDHVDGVYDDDPKKNSQAKFLQTLNYQDLIEQKLKVIDEAAATICDQNNIEILIFNQAAPNAFVRALRNEIQLTRIKKSEN